jgi:DNA-directed RNA polymerase subunit RPC12/RpoP
MKEECIICKAPIIYLEKDEMMECVLCHKKELSKTRCEQGHYVCNECHTKGMDVIIDICLSESDRNYKKNDGTAILSYAWTRASCYGWFSASYRI